MVRRLPIVVVIAAGCGSNPPEWTPLFDGKTLDGWYSYLDGPGRDNDEYGIFRVEDGMIHILGTDLPDGAFHFGYLATTSEYDNFHLRFEYKWGPRNFVGWGPDSGFFIAAVGPDRIWPRSQECQVMAGDTGSMYMFDYATIDTTIDPLAAAPTYLTDGAAYTAPRNAEPNYARVTHSRANDVRDDWNTVEVIANGDSSEFIVNGVTTFRSTGRRQPADGALEDPSQDVPLVRGRLVIQQEGNEIYYRNVEIKAL